MSKRILIVGGVGGGATVASQIRRKDKEATIILFEKGDEIAFSNCGMPYYIGDVVESRDKLLVSTDGFSKKYDVDVRLQSKVIDIERHNKTIHIQNNQRTYTETYDKLILAPGATPIRPDMEGMQPTNTFTLRTIPDMDRIQSYIDKEKPTSAAVVGAGFIGMEMVENLRAIGIECTLINRSDQVMNIVDKDMAAMIQEELENNGVHVLLNDGVESFSHNGKVLHLHSGQTVEAEMTILAVGIQPNTSLAKKASLKLGIKETIAVNAFMQTNDEDIYALGDAVEIRDFQNGAPRHIALAGPAHRQAYVIASHLSGESVSYNGSIGASILKVFDLTIAASGNTSRTLKEMNDPFEETILHGYEHAGYYPGSQKLTLKILFNATSGIIYSAQVVGYGGVDKRHAVLATAMKGNMTIYHLAELELAYAPPYSSPKDPINILGYKAIAQLEG